MLQFFAAEFTALEWARNLGIPAGIFTLLGIALQSRTALKQSGTALGETREKRVDDKTLAFLEYLMRDSEAKQRDSDAKQAALSELRAQYGTLVARYASLEEQCQILREQLTKCTGILEQSQIQTHPPNQSGRSSER